MIFLEFFGISCNYLEKNSYLCAKYYTINNGSKQRPQPPKGGSRRKKEVQPMAFQAVGLCANDSFEMVYQLITASVGNADEDNKVA